MEENQDIGVAAKEASIQQSMESAFAALQGGQADLPTTTAGGPVPPGNPIPSANTPTPVPVSTPVSQEPKPYTVSAAPTTEEQLKGMFDDPKPDQPEAPRPADVPDDTPIPEPEHMDEKQGNAFAQLRFREKQLRQVIEEQKKQLEAMKEAQAKLGNERNQIAEALKTRDDELKAQREKAGKLDLSASVEFRKRYDAPMQQAEANLDAVLTKGIVGTDTPEGLAETKKYIMADDATFRKYISELDEDLQDKIRSKRQALLEVQAERDAALKDWETTARGLSQTAAAESVADKLLARQHLAEAAEQFNLQATPVEKRPLILTEAYFADDVALANKAFKDFMQTATEEQIARAAHMGHLVPAMQRALVYALGQARQYQEAYYAIRGIAKPGSFAAPGSVAAPAAPVVPKATPQPVSPIEAKENAIADSIRGLLSGRPPVGGQG